MNNDSKRILYFLKKNPELARGVSARYHEHPFDESEKVYFAMGQPSWASSISWFAECTQDAIEAWERYEQRKLSNDSI